ncbi:MULTISPECIES: dienelactone hydrolase family protein [unclassified Herbaspirillum]|uniref:dienelactone hydrolase family protein n=1 Tax=unclassified Herbaspirillum TaxID=2624150 RepID=UPI001153DECF|nr:MULTISPECIES: dienelactone hydrolase family protein [unclassified Herbaspirillum]MBB5392569.1 carboxymethylenebutenolidase [Herbaspirillum sp. SJZ102]TQK06206.1 carboxymethylenebutenolidase [Herbaspirillum sp. SJZ130]TQK12316.1 carboxymethylenebutenolidase [Herbaspirillum sp. SJZ106]
MNDFRKDLDSLLGQSSLSGAPDRRTFLKTALGTGFAAAVLPVCAQTMIKTDTAGLTAGEVAITFNGQRVPAYRAQPEGKTNLPVVIVVSEIFGVHEHIADIARRFAKLGYLAIAPDFFIRQGNPLAYTSIAELQKDIISKVPDEQVMGDIDAFVAWAGENGGDTRRLGITGFCWGGRIVWLYSAHNPKVKAGAAWYGRLVGDKSALFPQQPIDIAPSLKVPVIGLYGAKDQGIPVSTVEQMKEALQKAGNKSEFHVYPNSGHAFNADYRPSYVEADAKDAWAHVVAWFKSHGVI